MNFDAATVGFFKTIAKKKVGLMRLFTLAFWKSVWKYKLQNKTCRTVEEFLGVWIIFCIIKLVKFILPSFNVTYK